MLASDALSSALIFKDERDRFWGSWRDTCVREEVSGQVRPTPSHRRDHFGKPYIRSFPLSCGLYTLRVPMPSQFLMERALFKFSILDLLSVEKRTNQFTPRWEIETTTNIYFWGFPIYKKRGRRVIGISGSLIWSNTLMELISNPCGEFRWSPEGPVSQIHSPYLHVGASGIFSDLLTPVQMLKREWGAESNGKLPHLFIPSKTAALVPEFAVEDLPLAVLHPWFLALAVKDLPLGRTLWWYKKNCHFIWKVYVQEVHSISTIDIRSIQDFLERSCFLLYLTL